MRGFWCCAYISKYSAIYQLRFNRLLTMATSKSSLEDVKPVIAVCQLTCTADKEDNFQTCLSLIKRASQFNAQMVFLPEACDYIGQTKQQSMQMAETLDGDIISRFRAVSKQMNIWLSIGGFHRKDPDSDESRVYNTHVVIDSNGCIRATYDKTHLFDLDLKGRLRLCESDYTVPGSHIVPPVDTPVGRVGLSTISCNSPKYDVYRTSPWKMDIRMLYECYDLRFPELSLALTQQGAQILTYPSAFTQTTGMAHWQVLLRSRAIETQCYVVAAAQTGKHNDKRSSYGHAMIVDPWGCVVAECHEGTNVCMAEIDLEYLEKIRKEMPVWQHRRHDLYGTINVHRKTCIESEEDYTFGQYRIKNACVFYRSALSFGFVNIKPVLPGHVLVASLRPTKEFADLTQPEVSDLFTAVQEISKVIKKHFDGTSLTVAIQDGPDAGQMVNHIHVHILPRRPGDFAENDDIYKELQRHDKDLSAPSTRSEEEMCKEAKFLRGYFTNSGTQQ